MFVLKGIYLLYSAILLLQFTNYCGAADLSVSASLDGLNNLEEAAEEVAEDFESSVQSSVSSYGQTTGAADSNSLYNSNTFNDELTSYIQSDIPSQFTGYSDLTTDFLNDGMQYGVNGIKAKIDFEKYLLEKGLEAAKMGGNAAKSGFSKTVDVGSSVMDYGVQGLKKKMEFEKALLDQGLRGAQSAGSLAKSGFGKSFNTAGKLGSGFSNFGGNLFRKGTNTFGSLMGQGFGTAQGAAEAAGSYGLGLTSGTDASGYGYGSSSAGTGGFSFGL